MKTLAVIPARMGSSRFPGKPLADLCGKPMVQWVYDACVASGVADRVVVATPDQEILDASAKFGAEAVLTSHDHLTGTDRMAEVAGQIEAEVYLNVQGDEPLIAPESIAACARPMLDDPSIPMASIFCECEETEWDNPAVVKVVTDSAGFALYFSRWAIPYPRNLRTDPVKKHVGLYAVRRPALLAFAQWAPSPLELAESLEQLRFMENGVRIAMRYGRGTELAVDTPEQAEAVREILSLRQGR